MINNSIASYYTVQSVLHMMANELDMLMLKGIVTPKKRICIYGLDKLSFAIRTLLHKRGLSVWAYYSIDKNAIIEAKREEKNFSSKYLNSDSDVIRISNLDEYLDGEILLVASPRFKDLKILIESHGLKENTNYFCIYDGVDITFENRVAGKPKIDISEMKRLETNILAKIDSFCEQNGIKYWACGGTLLGVIRHSGFIPWDDDIDIFMPWNDYRRFIDSFPQDNKYSLLYREVEKPERYFHYFSKVIDNRTILRLDAVTYRKIEGVWVDVFPLVGLPDDENERRYYFYEFQDLEKEMWENYYQNDGDLRNFSQWYKKQDELLGKYDFDNCRYVGTPGSYHVENDYASREVYSKTIRMPFENIKVNVPVGYKEYLTNLFGSNFMTPPSERDRQSTHDFVTYWIGDN